MGPKQGFFESDDDYRDRMEREANEETISRLTGSEPSQGFFESDADYADRVSKEANEHTIQENTGSSPRQSFFESDDAYVDRIEKEANESTVGRSTGGTSRQGIFESDSDYTTRVRKEANENSLTDQSGERPKQGFFEGDYEYRKRINHEANVSRASRKTRNKTNTGRSASYSYSSQAVPSSASQGPSGMLLVGILAISVSAFLWFGRPSTPSSPPLKVEIAAYQNDARTPSSIFSQDVNGIQVRARVVSGNAFPEDFEIAIRYPNGDVHTCLIQTCPLVPYQIRTIELGPSLFAPNRAGRDRISIALQSGRYTMTAYSGGDILSQASFQVRRQ
jgi:hypothetical protein